MTFLPLLWVVSLSCYVIVTCTEEKKEEGSPKEEEGEDPKPAEEGASAPTEEGGEVAEGAANEVTVQVDVGAGESILAR